MAYQEHKCDAELGLQVHAYLKSKGVETPMIVDRVQKKSDPKIKKIEKLMTSVLEELGMDLSDDSLEETPKRVAKMFVNELFWGLNPTHFPKCTAVENKMRYDEMVLEKDITLMSSCEHHLVTIDGKAHVAYIPDEKVLGLSKLNRIVEYFAKRPQIQERIAEQIFYALEYILGTSNIAVVVEGTHYCVKSRGIEDSSSYTITSKLGGKFKEDPALRAEFMSLVRS